MVALAVHRHNGHEIALERADNHHPIQDIEVLELEEIEDAKEKFRRDLHKSRADYIRRITAFAAHLEATLLRPGSTKQDFAVAFYQGVYGLGLPQCEGVTMTRRAEIWGVERATISKGAVQFTSGNDLEPSYYMKREGAREAYAEARIESIEENQKK